MILEEIRNDPVFRNDSWNPQAPVEYQLMVALSRFGHYGNGVSVMSVARNFRIAGEFSFLQKYCADFPFPIGVICLRLRGYCSPLDSPSDSRAGDVAGEVGAMAG